MVINSSNVALQSPGTYQSYMRTEVANVVTRGSEGATLELSDEARSLVEQFTFGSISIKASSTNMNTVLTDLRGTVSAMADTKSAVIKKY